MLAIFPTLNLSGIAVNICRKMKELFVAFCVDSLERSLEKMSCFFIFRIEVFSVSVKNSLHILRNSIFFLFVDDKVEMIWNKSKTNQFYISTSDHLFHNLIVNVEHSVFNKIRNGGGLSCQKRRAIGNIKQGKETLPNLSHQRKYFACHFLC